MTTLVSLLFITMIPIDHKITYTYLFAFFERSTYFLARAHPIISEKSVRQYASYSLIFSPSHSIMNTEQHESITTINPPIMKNTNVRFSKCTTPQFSGADPGFSKGGAKLTQWRMRHLSSQTFSVV